MVNTSPFFSVVVVADKVIVVVYVSHLLFPTVAVIVLAGATYPATTLNLARQAYAQLVRQHPPLAWALIKELGRRLQSAHQTILSLAAAGEKQGDAVRITIPLKRQDIADMTGTTVETAIRVMSKLRRLGLVDSEGRLIRILKAHQLVLFTDGQLQLH